MSAIHGIIFPSPLAGRLTAAFSGTTNQNTTIFLDSIWMASIYRWPSDTNANYEWRRSWLECLSSGSHRDQLWGLVFAFVGFHWQVAVSREVRRDSLLRLHNHDYRWTFFF